MAGELSIEAKSASVVDPLVGQAFTQIERQVARIETLAQRVGDALRVTTQSALPLATAFKASNDAATESAGKWQAALGEIGKRLSGQMEILPRLTKAYEGLGKAMGAARLPAAGQPLSEIQQSRSKVIDTSQTVLKSASSSVDQFAGYEGIISKLVLQGEQDPRKWAAQRGKVEAQVARMTYGTSLSKTQAATQLWGMFNAGMDLDELVPQGRLAARFTDGQQVDEGVTAGLFRTLSNGQSTEDLERLLNQIIGQVGQGKFGIANTAEAITRLLPQVGGAPEDAVRLAAILQQESKKTGNYNDVLSASKALFLEYKRQDGSSLADAGRYGQAFMPQKTDGSAPNYIEDKLEGRRQTLEWQQDARASSNERVSIGVGGALAPIYSHWTNLMTKGANILGVVVEQLSGVVTVVAGVVAGAAGLVTALAAVAKGKALLGAVRMVFGGPGNVVADAGKTALRSRVEVGDSKPGVWARTRQAAGKVGTLVPDFLRPSNIPGWQKLTGRLLGGIGSVAMAVDTYQNAGSAKEKSEGYGEAAGTLVGGLLGAVLGPLGAIAGGYIGGELGKSAGRKINEIWGEDSKKTVSLTPPLAQLPGADAGKLLTVIKEPGPGTLLLKNTGEAGGTTSGSGQGTSDLAPVIPLRGAVIDNSRAALGQYGGEHVLQAQRPASFENGDVVRSLAGASPTAPVLPGPDSATSLVVAATSPQHFAVSPTIAINVQGSLNDPAEIIRVLQPEIQRMFNGFAAQANSGGQVYDRTDDIYGYA